MSREQWQNGGHQTKRDARMCDLEGRSCLLTFPVPQLSFLEREESPSSLDGWQITRKGLELGDAGWGAKVMEGDGCHQRDVFFYSRTW